MDGYNGVMKKRGRGRPKLKSKDVRSVRLPLRVKPSEAAYLEGQAKLEGMKYCDYLRKRLIPS